MLFKSDFVKRIQEKENVSKAEAARMYDVVFDTLYEFVSDGNEVAIPEVGRLKIVKRGERVCRNPVDGSKIHVPARFCPKFQFSKNIKSIIYNL